MIIFQVKYLSTFPKTTFYKKVSKTVKNRFQIGNLDKPLIQGGSKCKKSVFWNFGQYLGIYHLNKDWKKEKTCQLQQVPVKVKYLSKSWLFYSHRWEHRSYWDCKSADVRIKKMKQKITTQNIHRLILQLLMKSHKSTFQLILKIQNLQHQMLLLVSASCFYWNSVIERLPVVMVTVVNSMLMAPKCAKLSSCCLKNKENIPKIEVKR